MTPSFGRRCLLLLCLTAIQSGHAAVQVINCHYTPVLTNLSNSATKQNVKIASNHSLELFPR